MSRVTILGCGPAGLAAAAAVVSSGHRATVLSNTVLPSQQYGCQYLHAPIPGFEDVPHTTVKYSLIGSPEEYRAKVYGGSWQGKVSPEDFIGEHEAWDIRKTYLRMWDRFIFGGKADFYQIPAIADGILPWPVYANRPDLIISTIPAPAMCYRQEHEFHYHTIFANGTTDAIPYPEDAIVCDGTEEHDWYRISRVFGYQTTEWPAYPRDPAQECAVVPKPLVTDCDCYPEIHRIGRYGKWQKSYLVHQAYPEVLELLK
jgi:hypothetical protein